MTEEQKIKELEDLVNQVADCYDLPADELTEKISTLTGEEWDAEEIGMYCWEYWSHHSLKETVSALMNGGEYPDNQEIELVFWKEKEKMNASDEEIYLAYRLGKEEKFVNKLEKLPVDQMILWIGEQFKDWKVRYDASKDANLQFFDFSPEEQKIYGKIERVHLSVYNEQLLCAGYTNIEETKREEMIAYMESLGTKVYATSNRENAK